MAGLQVLHAGASGEQWRRIQAAANRRLKARGLDSYAVKEDGAGGPLTMRAIHKAGWALGALLDTLHKLDTSKTVSVGLQAMILNPGKRSPEQLARGKARIANLRHDRAQRQKHDGELNPTQLLVVKFALQAAANYRANPGAYHYLAGGVANLIFLEPSPRGYRSDCSQFDSSVQDKSGGPALGPNGPLWVNTDVMDGHLEVTDHPVPADFGMYGRHHGGTHHTELYLGAAGGPGHEFVGHGSPPIDSLTPGRPDFYLKNPCR